MTIRRYTKADEAALFTLLAAEGGEWIGYYGDENKDRYKRAVESSVTYLAFDEDVLCGYCRCRDDDGFGVYVYDLLVDRDYRGRHFGRLLMERVCADYPGDPVYVMSDVDAYYEKQGYRREGSVFEVIPGAAD
ncbi:MAG: GNAT family N-acetyltransferase [Oscillospiraceae bacterium]|jgi:ribosomal protein S18 acetylase RimI-like enzyme|nr:GNAT family N-acetyltransferase [Oscillospiraceae bacterium]